MKVLVATGGRAVFVRDGTLWTNVPGSGRHKWERYLKVFDEVILAVRARRANSPPEGWVQMSAPGIIPWKLPYFEGPWQFLRLWPMIFASCHRALRGPHAVILRAPHHVSDVVLRAIDSQRPFGAEIVGDPASAFDTDSIQFAGRTFLQWYFTRRLELLCSRACAVAYVTKNMLQDRYPAAPGALKTHYSSVELAVDAFTNQPKGPSGQPFVLFHAGSMTNYHKGQDALIRAAGLLMNRGWDLELRLAGDGPLRVEFEKLAHSLGISEKVRFFGLLPDQFEVQKELDRSDILIFPSRSEGLPRVIIEAMARGLPCIASRAGGIPELLPSEDTIPAVEPQLLAEKIEQVLSSPSRLSAMSKRNINSAREYAADVLDERRIRFQKTLKTKTEDWFGRQNGQI